MTSAIVARSKLIPRSSSPHPPHADTRLVLRHLFAVAIDLDQRTIVLTTDQRVAIAEPRREVRRWTLGFPHQLAFQIVLRHQVAIVLREQESAIRQLLHAAIVAHAAHHLELLEQFPIGAEE